MKIIRARLKSVTPYSQSKAIGVEKQANENHDDYEKRTWPERVHCSALHRSAPHRIAPRRIATQRSSFKTFSAQPRRASPGLAAQRSAQLRFAPPRSASQRNVLSVTIWLDAPTYRRRRDSSPGAAVNGATILFQWVFPLVVAIASIAGCILVFAEVYRSLREASLAQREARRGRP